MAAINKPECATQQRVVALFCDELDYTFLGQLHNNTNRNIDASLLRNYLSAQKYHATLIDRALDKLHTTAHNSAQGLYDTNKAVYQLLRYGVPVKVAADQPTETVALIDWRRPDNNQFYIAEEVTVYGNREKRPDIVLYVNGIAVAVLELKNSRTSIGEGIRQSLTNQQPEFIADFFTTVQFVLAGNDTEGLRYGSIGTPEKFFLEWKEDSTGDSGDNSGGNSGYKLDKHLQQICQKRRLIKLMFDFVLFDGGVKKLPRPHQYFGVIAAQKQVRCKQGGIIWHTQGSGKSIVMVLLAKWILENNSSARVVIITDRVELDKQIERIFTDAGEAIERSSSGRELMQQLAQPTPRLLCSLLHKFGRQEAENFEQYIHELTNQPSPVVGELFVFVDECHRTQSGKLHQLMRANIPNAVFIGFTGTPLLKKDRATSLEVFGKYIHTYKFNEAVADGVVLELVYEARDIDQWLSSPQKVDAWFAAKTSGLNEYQQAALKKHWGTMQKVLSSRARIGKVVTDIVFDFSVKPRLSSETGNAILVAASIFEACCYYKLFQETELKRKCAVITSYNPHTNDIVTEDTGANTETDKAFIYNTYQAVLEDVQATPGKSKTETYEDQARDWFVTQPATMKLLVVVDKLLTGFDAPPCTYLYIDKSMQDHGLFQAICRVNRIDTADKEHGFIVDYKDLFRKVENAVAVYTSELDYDTFQATDCDVLLKDRLETGRNRLDESLERLEFLCEEVKVPRTELNYIQYFCGNSETPEEPQARAIQRATLYKAIAAFTRAYANLADQLEAAGYTAKEIENIKERLNHYVKLRETVRLASGETLDLKSYEADMRHLLDTYIQADDSVRISPEDGISLVETMAKHGLTKAIDSLPTRIKNNEGAVAEVIENNVRSKIMRADMLDPAYYDKMSKLLDEIIRQRKQDAIDYQAYLQRMAELSKQVYAGRADDTPPSIDTKPKLALYHYLQDETQALAINEQIERYAADQWRGNIAKEREVKRGIHQVVGDPNKVEDIFDLVRQQNEY